MDNIQFCKSFYFATFNFKNRHHTDNSRGTVCHHIGYIKSGSAKFDVGGTVYEFCAGDAFYTPPNCRYHSYWEGENITYDSFAFHTFVQEGAVEYGVQKLTMNERAASLLHALSENKSVNCKSVGLLYELLYEILPTMIPTVRDREREMLGRALECMRRDIDISVPNLAKYLGMSESALYTLFRNKAHSTPITEKKPYPRRKSGTVA